MFTHQDEDKLFRAKIEQLLVTFQLCSKFIYMQNFIVSYLKILTLKICVYFKLKLQ